MARTAYSVRCAHLRMTVTTELSASWEICGKSQRKIGARMREECSKDLLSLEAEKISTIQSNAGSQYLMNERAFDTPHKR